MDNMTRFKISNTIYSADNPRLNDALAAMYGSLNRPLCLCYSKGIEMVIAKLGRKYIMRRMPYSGSAHATSCDSYEPPAELIERCSVRQKNSHEAFGCYTSHGERRFTSASAQKIQV